MTPTPEALALLEFSSIGRGARVLDDVVKKAAVTVHTATASSNGKYLLIFTGDVGSVEESFRQGVTEATPHLVGRLFLPQIHRDVFLALESRRIVAEVDALAIVECGSMATAVGAADAAAKCAAIAMIEVRLGAGIGGKGFFTFTGPQSDVEASVAAAREVAERDGALITTEIIPNPSMELSANLAGESWRPQSLPLARKA